MAGAFSQVDLSQLPPPNVIEQLDAEKILSDMLADFAARYPQFTALVESDPAVKVLEAAAYQALLNRQRVNDAARAVMLSSAEDGDLDQIAANFNVSRLLIAPADDTTIPPTPAVYESDDDLRRRVTLSLEGYTNAGSAGSYVFHALSASGDVKDVSATSPEPGRVQVFVLSRTGDGTASTDLVDAVAAALNAEKVRPMTDLVTVSPANIVEYEIVAELVPYPGPDGAVILAAAQAAAAEYVENQHKMGYDITLSGVYSVLHQAGVQRVNLASPADNIQIGDDEAPYCTGLTITLASAPDV